MTMQEYQESRERATKMIELMRTNPEEATKQALKSWEPVVGKINRYREQLVKGKVK